MMQPNVAQAAARATHCQVIRLRVHLYPRSSSQVMVLQGRLIIVGDRQRVPAIHIWHELKQAFAMMPAIHIWHELKQTCAMTCSMQ